MAFAVFPNMKITAGLHAGPIFSSLVAKFFRAFEWLWWWDQVFGF